MGQGILDSWRLQRSPEQTVDAAGSDVRTRLRRILGLGPEPALALCPSGTDAIYLASAVVLAQPGVERVHHVVVGANELGGGTLSAARGLTFSTRTPFGGHGEKGKPVEGLTERCTAEPFYLRGEEGGRIDLDVVDEEMALRVREVVATGATVLIHLVVHSKTGLRAPSLGILQTLRRELGDKVVVMVDAAQGRVGPRDVQRALKNGFMVLWTGSKFYSGPPFSAALVFPAPFDADPGPLPPGLRLWFCRADLPFRWVKAREALPEAANPGLVLRWLLAMEETEAYHAIPEHLRGRVYHTFAAAVIECFGPSPYVRLDLPQPPVHLLASGLGSFPSVLCFALEGPNGRLDATALRALYELLDTDLSDEDARFGTRFHLGQPVPLGPPDGERRAVLRVALGSRLVTQLHRAPDAGAAWFRRNFQLLREKAEWAVRSGRVG